MGNVLDKGGFEFPEYTFTVERGKIKEFVQAIGDDNPLYTDREYAAGQGYRDIIAPPTFGVCVDMWGGPGFDELCAKLEVNPVMVLHGEQEFEYFGEINSGDELTASPRVVKVAQKKGKSGGMNFVTLETTYRNQRGEQVLVSRMLLVERV